MPVLKSIENLLLKRWTVQPGKQIIINIRQLSKSQSQQQMKIFLVRREEVIAYIGMSIGKGRGGTQ